MNFTATCPTCATVLYRSSEIRGEHHARNAWGKAIRLAQVHAVALGHDVEVDPGRRVVACRCAKCGAATPGIATGICDTCLGNLLERDSV